MPDDTSTLTISLISGAQFDAVVDHAAAIRALEAVLQAGDATGNSPLRTTTHVGEDHLLSMPAAVDGSVGVKLVTVAAGNPSAGLPRIQGLYVLFSAETMAPAAVFDAVNLTNCRTAAVSALAVRHLAPQAAETLLVFGTGPQAKAHVQAISQVRPLRQVTVVGRSAGRGDQLVADLAAEGFAAGPGEATDVARADIIACCTSASEPLFDSTLLRPEATVVAMGSHSPDAREVDGRLVADATTVVETRDAAWAEAGDIVLAVADGVPREEAIDADLTELVREPGLVAPGRPRLFKSVGQGWSDVIVARLAAERLNLIPDPHPGVL